MQRLLLASTIALVLAATACASDTDDGSDDKTVEVKVDQKQTDDGKGADKSDTALAKQSTDSPLYARSTDSPLYARRALATDSPLY